MAHDILSDSGYLRLNQIIGQKEVTEQEAAKNREVENQSTHKGKLCIRPKRPRPAIIPLIPVSRSAWWLGVKSGRYPKPIKIGPRTTAWLKTDIERLINEINQSK